VDRFYQLIENEHSHGWDGVKISFFHDTHASGFDRRSAPTHTTALTPAWSRQ
jgi:hypothetical protein